MTETAVWFNRKTMNALHTNEAQNMTEDNTTILKKIHEEFAKFETTMEELYLLKRVAADLKNYRKMIKLKRYDWWASKYNA